MSLNIFSFSFVTRNQPKTIDAFAYSLFLRFLSSLFQFHFFSLIGMLWLLFYPFEHCNNL